MLGMTYQLKTLGESIIFAGLALALSIGVMFALDPIFTVTLLEFSAVMTSYMCTYLFVKQKRMAYPVGVVTTALYSWLFFVSGLPGLALFNLYMVGSLAYGYWRWGPDDAALNVDNSFKAKDLLNYGVITPIAISALLIIASLGLGFHISALDFVLTVMSGVAQLALDNKRKFNWYIWIAVNIVSLYVFWNQGLYFVFIQYIYMLGNAFYALKKW